MFVSLTFVNSLFSIIDFQYFWTSRKISPSFQIIWLSFQMNLLLVFHLFLCVWTNISLFQRLSGKSQMHSRKNLRVLIVCGCFTFLSLISSPLLIFLFPHIVYDTVIQLPSMGLQWYWGQRFCPFPAFCNNKNGSNLKFGGL